MNDQVLIYTGSFVTLMDKRLASKVPAAKEIQTSLEEVVGIGNVTKAIDGAILTEISVGDI